jgi:hypothetical protein
MKVRFDRARPQALTSRNRGLDDQTPPGRFTLALTTASAAKLRLFALTHNLMILVVVEVFYTARLTSYPVDPVNPVKRKRYSKP